MKTALQIVSDFAEFYGLAQHLRSISDALNNDRTFERALAAIGMVAIVVIGVTL